MRAKEYIEQNQATIKYLDDVKRAINELIQLRHCKEATDKYFNDILSADIRRQNYLLQKDLYSKNNAMQQEEPQLEYFENEISIEKASEVRDILFQVIKNDNSFGYIYFLLGTEQNSKHKNDPIDCIPNQKLIEETIKHYRDDYPKQSLDDYLDDEFNYQQYDYLISNNLFEDNPEVLLHYFNKVYSIYDDIRCHKGKISQLRQYCQQIAFSDNKEKYSTLVFIIKLIEYFGNSDIQLDRCKKELIKIIEPIRTEYEPSKEKSNSKVFLNDTRGFKLNFIRVINVLYELDFFKSEKQNKITKKDIFKTFGETININLTDYDKDLSRALTDSTTLDKHLKIFHDMEDKMKDIFNSK
jgi:hypothetical protein